MHLRSRPGRVMAARALLGTALALLLAAVPADGQRPDSAAVADTTRALPLPPVVVSVSRTPLRADRVGFAVTAIDRVELDRRQPAYAADALRTVPGAFIEEAAGPGGPTIVRLRGGEEVFTQVVLDGVQINENGGFFDFQGLALSNLERIEVARGPQSALYGSSAVSGVVHFIGQRGTPGPPVVDAVAEGGGAAEHGGSWRGSASVLGGSETVRYAAGAGAAYSRGVYALPHDTESRDAAFRLDLVPSDRFDASATLRWIDVEGNLPVRDPGATRAPLDPNARNERTRVVAATTARFAATDAWSHELRASLYREDFRYEDQRDDVAAETSFPFFIFDADFTLDSERERRTVEYAGLLRLVESDEASALLSYGGLWQDESVTDRTAGEFGDGRQALDRENVAGFVELAVTPVRGLDVLAGARVERFEGLDAAWTPRASAVVAVVPGTLSLRAAAGRGYKAPNLQQQYLENPFIESNPDLAPETSTSWEIGADARVADRVQLGVTIFRQRYEDLIRAVATEAGDRQINRNLGASRAQGIEWNAAVRVAPRWTLGSDGAWIATEILDNVGLNPDEFPEGEALPFRPAVVGSAYVHGSAGRLGVHARATLVGAQTVLTERFSGARERLDPYALLGVTASWAVSPALSVYTRLENLLDVEYDAAFDRRGIPLTAAVGLRLSY